MLLLDGRGKFNYNNIRITSILTPINLPALGNTLRSVPQFKSFPKIFCARRTSLATPQCRGESNAQDDNLLAR